MIFGKNERFFSEKMGVARKVSESFHSVMSDFRHIVMVFHSE